MLDFLHQPKGLQDVIHTDAAFQFLTLCHCVLSWQNVFLETPIVAGTITGAILSLLPSVFMSVCGHISGSTVVSHPCKTQPGNLTGV